MLQYEVQKSMDFIDATRMTTNPELPSLHISLESVELELPILLSEADLTFDPKEYKGTAEVIKRLEMPYTPKNAVERGSIPRKSVAGKGVEAQIIGPLEKLDEKVQKEYIGRVKVVLKPVVK
jgi:hypothetical protein